MRRRRTNDRALLAPLVKDYFDWSVTERRLSPRTVHSYRDAMVLFLRHLADSTGGRIEELAFPEELASHVLTFLRELESKRGVSVATRNHRLSVIKSFCRFVAYRDPLLAVDCRRVTALPVKKDDEKLLSYLEPDEMEAILDTVETMRVRIVGRRKAVEDRSLAREDRRVDRNERSSRAWS
jgi:integrase/recombinase XerD